MTSLGPNFTLENVPCYQSATAEDVAKLRDLVDYVLQPVRNRWGPVIITSWKWWRTGCVPRTGPHSGGGTVDFVTPNASLKDVFAWGVENLPRDYVGRWIYEMSIPGVQEEHIHVASRADMVAVDGKYDSAAYVETSNGVYTPVEGWGGASGTISDPIQIEGLTVTVSRPIDAWAVGGFGLLVALALRHRLKHKEG